MSGLNLLVSDHHGIYVPQVFVDRFEDRWDNVSCIDWGIVPDGPDHEWYWESWHTITNNATYSEGGNVWRLFQDGDLWAYCPELMTEEEYENFFGESK